MPERFKRSDIKDLEIFKFSFARERGFIQVKLIILDLQTQPRMELAATPLLKQRQWARYVLNNTCSSTQYPPGGKQVAIPKILVG